MVVLVVVVVLALVAFGAYGLVHGTSMFGGGSANGSASAQGGSSVAGAQSDAKSGAKTGKPTAKPGKASNTDSPAAPDEQAKLLPHCGAKEVELDLKANHATIPVGGSVEFTAVIRYNEASYKKGFKGCIVDGSDASRVLSIYSGSNTVWRSDVCPTDPRKLAMYRTSDMNHDERKLTWNADQTGTACQDDAKLPRVDRGGYTAQLSLKEHPRVKSNKVDIIVE